MTQDPLLPNYTELLQREGCVLVEELNPPVSKPPESHLWESVVFSALHDADLLENADERDNAILAIGWLLHPNSSLDPILEWSRLGDIRPRIRKWLRNRYPSKLLEGVLACYEIYADCEILGAKMPLMLANSGSGKAFIRYSIQDNEWLMSSLEGEPISFEWDAPVLVDIEKIQMGWMKLEGGRDFVPWPDNDPSIPRPADNYKQAFCLDFYSTKLFRDEPVRELSSSAAGLLEFIKRLYDEVEAAGGFGKEQVPALQIGKAEKFKLGRGPTKVPTYKILGYKPRPEALQEVKETFPVSDDLDDVLPAAPADAPKKVEEDSFENMEI